MHRLACATWHTGQKRPKGSGRRDGALDGSPPRHARERPAGAARLALRAIRRPGRLMGPCGYPSPSFCGESRRPLRCASGRRGRGKGAPDGPVHLHRGEAVEPPVHAANRQSSRSESRPSHGRVTAEREAVEPPVHAARAARVRARPGPFWNRARPRGARRRAHADARTQTHARTREGASEIVEGPRRRGMRGARLVRGETYKREQSMGLKMRLEAGLGI